MTATVAFLRAARADVLDAREWYDEQVEGLGQNFVAELEAALIRIVAAPKRFPEVRPGVGKAPLKRFPFSVFFENSDSGILVIAVFHARRDPRVWNDRTRT